MEFTRSTYPDAPGVPGYPCWTLRARRLYADLDWNTRRPYGGCLTLLLGPALKTSYPGRPPGFTLDMNAPLGEPNRLYLFLGRVRVTLGLVQFRDEEITGREVTPGGRNIVHVRYVTRWTRPHLAGLDRYRWHRKEDGGWARDARPAPLHWGWLTIERAERGE